MTLPFLRKPYIPQIKIQKNDNPSNFYDFDPLNDVRDFIVRRFSCTPTFDGVSGRFELLMTSQTGSNSAMNDILDNIEEGNELHLWAGKTLALKQKMFLGMIENVEITEENPNF